ncbi:MAG: AmmeMemoRadiSam system protein B [Patescibacteria group bacterium]
MKTKKKFKNKVSALFLLSVLFLFPFFAKKEGTTGAILPHHTLASPLIAELLQRVDPDKVETIILFGPDHFKRINFPTSSFSLWQTPAGVVKPESDLIEQLSEEGQLVLNGEIVGQEHSITELLPFIAYYLPKAKIVPIVLPANFNNKQLEELASKLAQQKDGVLFLASIDFSHYLSQQEALEKDQETIQAIKDFNYEVISKMDSDFLDSPASLMVLLKILEKQNKKKVEILGHSNSALLGGTNSSGTTSYLSVIFY